MLMLDLTAPRKQRHTVKRIYDRLIVSWVDDLPQAAFHTPPPNTAPTAPTNLIATAQSRAGTISTKCTARVSPGSAPSSQIGPVRTWPPKPGWRGAAWTLSLTRPGDRHPPNLSFKVS